MPSRSPSPLRIAIVGAGKIGSAFAFQLGRTGNHDVTVVARPRSARLQQLQGDNGIVNIKGERASVGVTDTLDDLPAWVVAAMLWMMSRIRSFRALLATRKNECRALVDVMVAAAPRANPPVRVPRIRAMKPA